MRSRSNCRGTIAYSFCCGLPICEVGKEEWRVIGILATPSNHHQHLSVAYVSVAIWLKLRRKIIAGKKMKCCILLSNYYDWNILHRGTKWAWSHKYLNLYFLLRIDALRISTLTERSSGDRSWVWNWRGGGLERRGSEASSSWTQILSDDLYSP